MFGSALDKVTGFLDPRMVLTSLLPSLGFWAAVGALAGTQVGWSRIQHWWAHLSSGAGVLLAIAAVAALTLFALVLSAHEGALLSTYEGYWGRHGPTAWLANTVAGWRRRHARKVAANITALDAAINNLSKTIKALERSSADLAREIEMLASNGVLAPQLQQLKDKQQKLGNTEKKLQDQQAMYADKDNRSKALTEYLYRNYPSKLDRILPTRLGNIIKAAEEYPADEGRYGIDAVFFWPRLIAVVPDAARGDLSDARASMALLLNVSTLGFLLGVGSFTALAAAMLHPAAAFWACGAGGLVLAALAYRSALAPSRVYAELVRAAFDLYRVDLLNQLKFGLPDNLDEERALWQNLGQQMYLGAATSPDILDAARARTVNPPPQPSPT
ncbi:MAG: hypothetical protein JWM19_3195, partial [Actinomycetia bacterium]|nr:hypothetical protein [Actinomycetes bacterium]